MQFIFYAVIFVVTVTLVANFIQTIAFPPLAISRSDLPAIAQHELQRLFPRFIESEVKHIRPRHRYTLTGSLEGGSNESSGEGVACRFQFDLTPDGELAELKYRDLSNTKFQMMNKRSIPTTAVPARIADQMNAFLDMEICTEFRTEPLAENEPSGSASHSSHSARAFSGMVENENAFEIELLLGDFEYEFVFTESGRMVEFEKEHGDF